MPDGIRVPDMGTLPSADLLLAVSGGTTGLLSSTTLATILAGSGPIADAIGSASVLSGISQSYYFVATEGQTEFGGVDLYGATVEDLSSTSLVYLNGYGPLQAGSDFSLNSALDGVEFSAGLTEGDVVVIVGSLGGGLATRLTGDRTYFVSPEGDDAATGLSSDDSFATLQRAADAVQALDLNGHSAIISVADGTYNAGALIQGSVKGARTPSSIRFVGAGASRADVVVSATGADCFRAENGAMFRVENMTLTTATGGNCLNAPRGYIEHADIGFGSCAGFHKQATDAGKISSTGDYAITAGGVAHFHVTSGAYILVGGGTVTVTGAPAFSSFFAGVSGAMLQVQAGVSWSGAATGQRFSVHNAGAIRDFTGSLDSLPGDSAGVAYGGGSYEDFETLSVLRSASSPLLVVNDADVSDSEIARFRGERATPAVGDTFYNHLQAMNDAGEVFNAVRQGWIVTDPTDGSEDADYTLAVRRGGALVTVIRAIGSVLQFLVPPRLPSMTVVEASAVAGSVGAGALAFITDESGGACVACSDGAAFRRVDDNTPIS